MWINAFLLPLQWAFNRFANIIYSEIWRTQNQDKHPYPKFKIPKAMTGAPLDEITLAHNFDLVSNGDDPFAVETVGGLAG